LGHAVPQQQLQQRQLITFMKPFELEAFLATIETLLTSSWARAGNTLVSLYVMHALLTERMKGSAMTMQVQQEVNTAEQAVTRTDVVRLLQEVESPEQLDVRGQNLRGIDLLQFNLKGANMSHARICEANLCGANLSQADLHGADLRGAFLDRTDLRGADLSWAPLGGANPCELTRSQLRRSGAIFREPTTVIVAERFSAKAGRYALGSSLGLLCMSVVGFLMGVGIRLIVTHRRQTTHLVDHWDETRRCRV
jgi:hypothetical protein